MKRKPAPRKPNLLLVAVVALFVLLLLLRLFVFVHGRNPIHTHQYNHVAAP